MTKGVSKSDMCPIFHVSPCFPKVFSVFPRFGFYFGREVLSWTSPVRVVVLLVGVIRLLAVEVSVPRRLRGGRLLRTHLQLLPLSVMDREEDVVLHVQSH